MLQFMDLCHTAAILSRETKVALFYLSSLAPKFFAARSGVVRQSFCSLSEQYGRRVNMAHWVPAHCALTVLRLSPRALRTRLFTCHLPFS